jgi:FKBP-type peptidyl-prolyl cis-trans isomerase FklB
MKSLILPVLAVGLGAGMLDAAAPKSAPPAPTAPTDKVSYIIGYNIGSGMARDGIEISKEQFLAGFSAALAKQPSVISPADMQATMQAFQQKMQAKQQAAASKAGAAAGKEGIAFLAANKAKPGIKTTASGLQYQIVKAGTGKTPTATDTVTTHYAGTLISGKEFDSSYKRGQPASFPVNGVIKGWTEALQMMKVGAKWRLFIPSGLAYGERGAGRDIPPNATLIFDIELLKIGK